MPLPLHIAPSILSADFGRLNDDIATIEPYADWVHIDVMDGHFVPNLTFGAPVVKDIKTSLVKDCHLMIEHPEKYISDFAKAGAQAITVHAEAVADIPAIIRQIKAAGCRAGLSVKPNTPAETIFEFLADIDLVLVMTVEPGFGGQSFIEACIEKVRLYRALRPDLDISVDGGINAETARIARDAGANVLVAGSYIFGSSDRAEAIVKLRA